MESNLRKWYRIAKNTVKQYDEAEARVREATSNDPWGATGVLMAQISEDMNDPMHYQSSFGMIWKRVSDVKHYKHILKALVLIDYLLKHGNKRFLHDLKLRKGTIKRLEDFTYWKNGADVGEEVRNKAGKIVELLNDKELLEKERKAADRVKGKIFGLNKDSAFLTAVDRKLGRTGSRYEDYSDISDDEYKAESPANDHNESGSDVEESMDASTSELSTPSPKNGKSKKKPAKADKKKRNKRGKRETEEEEEVVFPSPVKSSKAASPSSDEESKEVEKPASPIEAKEEMKSDDLLLQFTQKTAAKKRILLEDFVTGNGYANQSNQSPLLMLTWDAPVVKQETVDFFEMSKAQKKEVDEAFVVVKSNADEISEDDNSEDLLETLSKFSDLKMPAGEARKRAQKLQKKKSLTTKTKKTLNDLRTNKNVPAYSGAKVNDQVVVYKQEPEQLMLEW